MGKKIRRKQVTRRRVRQVDTAERPVTLDEVLVAFQKTLARATRSAREVSRSDAAFATGEKTLYLVDGLDLELNAGFRPATTDDTQADYVEVDFNAPPEDRSTVRFRVEAKPLEPVAETTLTLSDRDPLNQEPGLLLLRAMLIGPTGRGEQAAIAPLGRKTIQVHVIADGQAADPVELTTVGSGDNAGLADFVIDPALSQLVAGNDAFELGIDTSAAESLSIFASSVDPPASSTALTLPVILEAVEEE